MIDTHCHLDAHQYGDRQALLVDEAVAAGVACLITIGADLPSSKRAVTLAAKFPSVWAAVGIHPHDATTCTPDALGEIASLAREPKVVAIGEIGLDYYRDLSPRSDQKRALQQQLELAVRLGLPVVIHTRDSFDDTFAIIREYAAELTGGVFHCFPGTPAEADQVFSLGSWLVSFGGVITYKNSQMAKTAACVPLERIMLETDAPYLTPVPHRGEINRPALLSLVADQLALLRGIPTQQLIDATDKNARALFRLGERFAG